MNEEDEGYLRVFEKVLELEELLGDCGRSDECEEVKAKRLKKVKGERKGR